MTAFDGFEPLTQAHWKPDMSVELQDLTVGGLLRQTANAVPDREALVEGKRGDRRRWTYRELLADSETVARSLLTYFAPGDRVALWAPNQPEWVLVQFGSALAGLVLVTVNPASTPEELRFILEQSKAVGLLYADSYRGTPMARIAREVAPRVASVTTALPLADWDAVAGRGGAGELPAVHPRDPAQIQFTSGTTGAPKGALLQHHAITNSSNLSSGWISGPAEAPWLNTLPMFHAAGCITTLLGAVWRRASHIVAGKPDPGLILELIEAERVELIGAVPTILIGMIEHPDVGKHDLSSLTIVLTGGAVVPVELVRRIQSELGVDLCNLYGQTELTSVVTATRPADSDSDKAHTIGRALPRTELAIVDPLDRSVLPIGVSGEICARGYQLMLGYVGRPDETVATVDADGWLHTGDLGMMDKRGYVQITGRLKELIIRGGENIQPREVEERLYKHPAIGEVVVVGVPDHRLGERVAAVIRFREGAQAAGRDALRAWCKERLGPQKVPSDWFTTAAFPMTTSGKIQRHLVRQQAQDDLLTPLD